MKERIEAAIARIEQGVHTGAGHFFGHATVILRGIVEDLEDTVEMAEADIASVTVTAPLATHDERVEARQVANAPWPTTATP